VIAWLRVLKFGQNINEDAPESHQAKQGTPTMGGFMLVLGVSAALLVQSFLGGAGHRLSAPLVAVWLVFLAHAVLGFLDDYLKTKRGKSLGLKARQKLAGQFLVALVFIGWRYLTAMPEFTTVITVWRGVSVDLGYGYYVLALLLMVGMSNSTNLADGLDGLAGGLSILTALGLSWTVYTLKPGYEGLPLFGYVVAGACLGFLWFNAYPAKVFMGDTGSLALGSSFAALAIVGKQEILLLVFGLVFLMETISVMIQVSVFKATGGKPNGRRVFKMTPIHHHFEKSGWAETQVVTRFWILGVIALVVGLLLAPSLSVWVRPR
jgi:phospho-N-acetylmuramoyl-pentapeptide-transferase